MKKMNDESSHSLEEEEDVKVRRRRAKP
ncbi:hypothetical protein A2U01_0057095 [Trifolium medium]|uniref:Uncharacterized protein n=1 Tax=Trifolium medium TaxID=97028 RepID=A0A392RIM5_9FABA|nr:hypothetical protein [Trifolium medium]